MMTILTSSRWNAFLDWARLLLLHEDLRSAPPYSYGRDSLLGTSSHIHDYHMDGKLQAPELFDMAQLETCASTWSSSNHFFYLHNDDVLKVHMRAHSIFFFKTCLPWAQIPLDQTSDHSLNKTLVNPWSSSLSPSFCLETNKWSSSLTYGQILQV